MDSAYAVYLSIFAIVILLALIPRLKSIGFGKTAQMVAAWVLIIGGLVLLVGEWPRIQSALDPATPRVEGEEMRIATREDGHFHVRGTVNGVGTTFLVDTGASDIVLTQETAARAGLDPQNLSFDGVAATAM